MLEGQTMTESLPPVSLLLLSFETGNSQRVVNSLSLSLYCPAFLVAD